MSGCCGSQHGPINSASLFTGISVGIWMSHSNVDEALPSLVMQGLACGTILYVAFFEILERERSKSTVGLVQWTLLLAGFLAIMTLEIMGKLLFSWEPIESNNSYACSQRAGNEINQWSSPSVEFLNLKTGEISTKL